MLEICNYIVSSYSACTKSRWLCILESPPAYQSVSLPALLADKKGRHRLNRFFIDEQVHCMPRCPASSMWGGRFTRPFKIYKSPRKYTLPCNKVSLVPTCYRVHVLLVVQTYRQTCHATSKPWYNISRGSAQAECRNRADTNCA